MGSGLRALARALAVAVATAGCAATGPPDVAGEPTPGTSAGEATPRTSAGEPTPGTSATWPTPRVTPGAAGATPPALANRRLPPPDDSPHLAPPPANGAFAASVRPVPGDVARRSTWHEGCPVGLEELRYATVTFWGFDARAHTGELIAHERAIRDLVGVFERLYHARFPIEELRVVRASELEAPPTGDGNTSTAFVCRQVTGGSGWSQHARGLAVDINPFHNPYVRGDVVVPELAGAYLDRDRHRPGMIRPGSVATRAFADIGWGWGGQWDSPVDWMHFSASGR